MGFEQTNEAKLHAAAASLLSQSDRGGGDVGIGIDRHSILGDEPHYHEEEAGNRAPSAVFCRAIDK